MHYGEIANASYDDPEWIWEASETFNNADIDDLRLQGAETVRVVHENDKRWPVGQATDEHEFSMSAGCGRVRSYGGSNGVGGFWAGYIGAAPLPYYTGKEVRPMNVSVRFWRRTS